MMTEMTQPGRSVADPRELLFRNLHRRKIPGLDGIRGIAALTVVAFHAISTRAPGGFAVLMFFILSGLLITWLLLTERHKTGGVDLRAFYLRRALRLLPPLFVLLVWEGVVRFPPSTGGRILAAALYYANYYGTIYGPEWALSHTWSLAIEEHFYLIWPAIFRRSTDRDRLLKGLMAAAVLSALYRLDFGYAFSAEYVGLATESNAAGILAGCALAIWVWQSHEKVPRFLFHPWLAVVSLLIVVALAQTERQIMLLWGFVAAIPCLAVILLQAVAYEWRFLENPVARFLGRISYSIYLWHIVAVTAARYLRLTGWLPYGAAILGAVGIATLSHFAIERPALRLAARWRQPRGDGLSAAAGQVEAGRTGLGEERKTRARARGKAARTRR
jgi:peptidoglycan/LPS O-acetylase OafA/YrhL